MAKAIFVSNSQWIPKTREAYEIHAIVRPNMHMGEKCDVMLVQAMLCLYFETTMASDQDKSDFLDIVSPMVNIGKPFADGIYGHRTRQLARIFAASCKCREQDGTFLPEKAGYGIEPNYTPLYAMGILNYAFNSQYDSDWKSKRRSLTVAGSSKLTVQLFPDGLYVPPGGNLYQ